MDPAGAATTWTGSAAARLVAALRGAAFLNGSGATAVLIPTTARSMLRRAAAKLSTTKVIASPTFMNSRALRGAGSAMSRSGT